MLYLFESYALDTDRCGLRLGSAVVSVQPQVFDLLELLIRNRDRVVTKDDMLEAIWGGRIVSESTLTSRINAARAALGDSGEEQRLIRTQPRKGLRFVGDRGDQCESRPKATLARVRTAGRTRPQTRSPGLHPGLATLRQGALLTAMAG